MTASFSSSSSPAGTNISRSIPSDTISIRDLLLWNPFQQQRSRRATMKENERDDEDVTYDRSWILILNGSYRGFFDWIPLHLRTGKWSILAILYFRMLWCASILLIVYDVCYNVNNSDGVGMNVFDDTENVCSASTKDHNTLVSQLDCDSRTAALSSSPLTSNYLPSFVRRYWKHNATTILQISPVIIPSASFYYNAFVAVYMSYICYIIIAHSPMSFGAWITYTVQSWTLLLFRHLLYALSGLLDSTSHNDNNFVVLAELIRFPCAVAHTTTFIVWNFILVPYILGITLRNDQTKRQDFIRFCTSFRLLNLHGMNILFCVGNVWYFNAGSNARISTTTRTLEMADLYLSGASAFIYFTFYLCVLDRVGIHLYPIFSPRHSSTIVFVVWTSVILLYISTFHLWQYVLKI